MISLKIEGGGVVGNIDIDDGILSTTWTAVHPRAFGTSGGTVGSWGSGAVFLQSPDAGATPVLILKGLSSQSSPGDYGDGTKETNGGQMPLGGVTWDAV